jgi:hypothetical protein
MPLKINDPKNVCKEDLGFEKVILVGKTSTRFVIFEVFSSKTKGDIDKVFPGDI